MRTSKYLKIQRFFRVQAACLLFMIIPGLNAFGHSIPISYEIHKNDSASLEISLSFKLDKSGRSVVYLPSKWAGQHQLFRAISGFHAISTLTTVDTISKPDEYIVTAKAGMCVKITYQLKQDWTGPLIYPIYSRPVTRNDIFYFVGYNGLAYPEMPDNSQLTCTVSYTGFSGDEFTGNSFFAGSKTKHFHTTLRNLLNSVFCSGSFRTKLVMLKGRKIAVAVAGKFKFTDDALFNSITRIIQVERQFWKTDGSKYFFVALLQMDDHGNNGGADHFQSFVLFQSPDLPMNEGFLPLISHEYFHNWIGTMLQMPQPSEKYKWFSEGFTDYYSLKLLLNSGLITSESYLDKINSKIKTYYLSPYFTTSSDSIAEKYWTDSQMERLAYGRGLTLAFWLDNRIAESSSRSLDDLMLGLYKPGEKPHLFQKSVFDRLILAFADTHALVIINQANYGNNVPLTKALLDLRDRKMSSDSITKVFDIGFNLRKSMTEKKIVGLRDDSNAAKAGLKENAEMTGALSIYNNDPDKSAKIEILENGHKRMIEYLPVKAVNISVPQILE
jgi:predicted metalloprotease with PDZ domain